MTNASTSIRGLLTYAAILPLALLIGYLMATPTDIESFLVVSMVLCVLSLPLMLKWHRPMLFLTWNMTAVLFFLPGRPQIWVGAAFLSFVVILAQKTLLNKFRSLPVRMISAPIIFLLIVVFATAQVTGGVGLRAFGSDVIGGKAYFWILAAALGFFAMTAYPIPPEKRNLYLGLFFLGALTNAIGSSLSLLTPSFYYIFLIFPVDSLSNSIAGTAASEETITRYGGLGLAALGVYYYLLARNKLSDILDGKRVIVLLLCLFCTVVALGSGYRSHFILIALVFSAVFYFEGLLRSRYTAIFTCVLLIGGATLLPFANKLPMSIQRAISVVPFVDVSSQARIEAQNSTDWRINMWKVVWPEVPKYLWRGKGIGINGSELEMAETMRNRGPMGPYEVALQTGSYHNGFLTVIIPFGIWGLIGWLWFLGASGRALYLNFRNGDPELKIVNRFLLAFFCARVVFYFAVFGEFRVDFPFFAGLAGFSLALNGGIRRRVDNVESKSEAALELQPARATR